MSLTSHNSVKPGCTEVTHMQLKPVQPTLPTCRKLLQYHLIVSVFTFKIIVQTRIACSSCSMIFLTKVLTIWHEKWSSGEADSSNTSCLNHPEAWWETNKTKQKWQNQYQSAFCDFHSQWKSNIVMYSFIFHSGVQSLKNLYIKEVKSGKKKKNQTNN